MSAVSNIGGLNRWLLYMLSPCRQNCECSEGKGSWEVRESKDKQARSEDSVCACYLGMSTNKAKSWQPRTSSSSAGSRERERPRAR